AQRERGIRAGPGEHLIDLVVDVGILPRVVDDGSGCAISPRHARDVGARHYTPPAWMSASENSPGFGLALTLRSRRKEPACSCLRPLIRTSCTTRDSVPPDDPTFVTSTVLPQRT